MRHILVIFSTVLLLLHNSDARANFLEDVGRIATAPLTAPFEVPRRILRGDNPTEIIQGQIAPAGRVIQQGSGQLQRVQDVFLSAPRDIIQNNLGSDWRQAFDILTASQRIQFEAATTAGRFLGFCLQRMNCNLDQIAAIPLAAAMRDAYKLYRVRSLFPHPNIMRILSHVVPNEVVQRAQLVIGSTPDFTIPGFLNAANEAGGSGHAVTLGNVMIFSRDLDFRRISDWEWLLHEMYHVEQYMRYGTGDPLEDIDGFAIDYLRNSDRMESDARSVARQRRQQLDQICRITC